ncbi:MAG: hypothetical protein JW753_10220 [Dehalococcoidia bacterium]|nr:hypothetical protein [Dehalococcoidia bacterium]
MDIGGVSIGLVLFGGVIGLLVYMGTREMSAEYVVSAAALCLAALLLCLPVSIYVASPVSCLVARLMMVMLVAPGIIGVVFGGGMVIGESHDPGYGMGFIGGYLLAATGVLLASAGVLGLKAREGLKRAGEW